MAHTLLGRWFDGRSSRPRLVEVALVAARGGPALELRAGPDKLLGLANAQVDWPQAWSASRMPSVVVVDLREHGSVEIDDAAAWQQALGAAGAAPALAERMQTRWRFFLGVAIVALAGLFAFYRWGTPWAATQLTRQVPLSWELELSDRAMKDIDGEWLKPSRLSAERQAQLRARFDALAAQVAPSLRRYPNYSPALRLHFRSGLGANAFALPGGTMVLTDGLVELAAKHSLPDDALIGVLAHEIGHVVHRHGTRLVVEQAVLNVGLGLAMGDVSSVVSFGAAIVTGLAYRRGHESEADCFALALMRDAKLPTKPMAELLLRLDDAPAAKGSAIFNLLSSHPETRERAARLASGAAVCGN